MFGALSRLNGPARPLRSLLTRTHTRSLSQLRDAPEPLRILFCGSDGFSIASLEALNARRLRKRDFISSIDVVCRPGKRVGRGLKQIRDGESPSSLKGMIC